VKAKIQTETLPKPAASVSMLGYHYDLNEPVIRLWNDAPHRVGAAQHEESEDRMSALQRFQERRS